MAKDPFLKVTILLITLIFEWFHGFTSLAQTSPSISGKVVEIINGQETPVAFANVSIPNTSFGATTDFDGLYKFTLPAGNYEVIASFVGYLAENKEVKLKPGEEITLNFTLKTDKKTIATAVVQAERIRNTEKAVVAEIRQAQQIVSGIGSEQISKSQDRDAGEIIKRIPGITIIDDKYVNIRGLAERYNMVWLNNSASPSVETDVKAFAFDMVPSSLIDRMLIYKTPAPELPGEFAGGVIKVFTKTAPEKNEIKIGLSGGFRSGTTFQEFLVNKSGKTEWLGFDDGGRSIPENFPNNLNTIDKPESKEQLTQLGRQLPNNWSTVAQNANPDVRFNIDFIRRFNAGDKVKIGHITSINYSNTRLFYDSRRTDYNSYDSLSNRSDTIFDYHDKTYVHQIREGLLHNWSFGFGANHKIEFKNIFNQIGNNTTTLREGRNLEEGEIRREYSYRYFNRSIYTGQLGGIHKLFNELSTLDWNLAYSRSVRKDPDWRRIRTSRGISEPDSEPFRTYIPFTATPFFLGRLYFDLKESILTANLNLDQKIPFSANFIPHIRAGFYSEIKNRSFSARNLGYAAAGFDTYQNYALYTQAFDSLFADTNINSSNGLKITEDTKGSDSYTAKNELFAYYLALDIPLSTWGNLYGGARIEHNRQTLQSKDITEKPLNIDQNIVRLLPSLNLSINFSKSMLMRLAYGKTLNRPEFRELAPYAFYDFNFNNVIYGNDSLKTPSIHNFDARWEWYPDQGELVHVGFFYKQFFNPIETYFVPGSGSGGTRNFSFRNADAAMSYGVEVEVKKSLGFISQTGIWKDFAIVANGAYIKSQIDLGSNSAGQSRTRPMMGQSPYIVNGGVYYQNDTLGFSASLLYNVMGPRIRVVGTFGTPDIYEMPRNSLDLSISKFFWKKHLEIRFAAQNILNQPFLLIQDANNDGKLDRNKDQQQQSYRTGAYYTLGVVVRF